MSLKLLESKKRWILTSFGVDMFFFSNFWCWHVFLKLVQVKKRENWLVLVLTDCNLEPWGKLPSFGVDMFFSNSWNPIFGKLTSFGVDMFLSQLLESKKIVKKWQNCLVLVFTRFFSNSWNPTNGENWLVLVLTCVSQTPGIKKKVNID